MGFLTNIEGFWSHVINVFLGTVSWECFIFTVINNFIWILIVCLFEKQDIFLV